MNILCQCLQIELRPGDISYANFLARAEGHGAEKAHVADASETCNILFSSGTTGNKFCCIFTAVATHISSALNALSDVASLSAM